MQVVALDVGTTKIKASLIDPHGRVRATVSRGTAKLSHPAPGYMEVDAEEVYTNVAAALGELSKDLNSDDVIVSLSCMAPVLVLMGKTSKPLRPAILYSDTRSSTEVDELNNEIGMSRLLAINGNRANIQQWGPKILWLKRHEAATLAQTVRLFDLTSFLVWRFTGEKLIDYSVAEEGGLLDYRKMDWSREILSFLNIDFVELPSLKPTKHYCEILPAETARLDLDKRRAWMTVGCVDSIATPLAAGLLNEGGLSVELGTTGIIYGATHSPIPDARLYLDFSPIEGLYYVGGGTAASGIFYDWIVRLLMNGRLDYDSAATLAATSSPGSHGVVILPYILGERTPVFDAFARSIIFGLRMQTTAADILRGSMEAVAFSLLHNMRIMHERGYRTKFGSIMGGGAKNPLFRKIISDVLQLPFAYNASSSTTVGAAYIGYIAAGIKKRWEQVGDWLNPDESITPDPKTRPIYDLLFPIYLGLYEKHKHEFKVLNDI